MKIQKRLRPLLLLTFALFLGCSVMEESATNGDGAAIEQGLDQGGVGDSGDVLDAAPETTPSPTPGPSESPTPSATPTPQPSGTPTPSATPASSPTPSPTLTPSPTPTPSPSAAPSGNAQSAVGTNLSSVEDWSTEWVFTDRFKMTREWVSNSTAAGAGWNTGGAFASVSAQGVPIPKTGQVADAPVCTDGSCPPGTYSIFFDGTGTLSLWGSASNIQTVGPGHLRADFSGAQVWVRISASQAADPIRNIRVIMPGFESSYQTTIFHPLFLQRWSTMKVLRFMDWQRTNFSTQINWSDRATPSYYSQGTGKGVAAEIMVDLANTLDADPWFCMPHQATDDYVRQFATLVRDRLEGDRKIYLEYSNEVWNFSFPQATYAQQQGLALGLSANPFEAQLRYNSKRAIEMFAIWEQVFGGTNRLVRVMASQAPVDFNATSQTWKANTWPAETLLNFQSAYADVDALAIAPYFGGSLGNAATQAEVASWSLDELFANLQQDLAAAMPPRIAGFAQAAATYSLPLITYEAGQHLAGVQGAENNNALTNLFIAANRDPRMGALYTSYLNIWKEQGGTLFVNYTSTGVYGKWGSWGVLETMNQSDSTAHKYNALLSWIAQNPIWW